MKKLLIVESPAKIKTIAKFLGGEFQIMSTVGHIKDLPTRELGIVMTKDSIDLTYVPMKDKEKTIADLCKAASTADEIYLAPDPDREGEIIAWHTEQEIKRVAKKSAKIHRITFNEITKTAILEAVAHPYDVDMQKVAAQQARRILDRWVGYEVSPVLWRKIKKGLSAGRVQSVALRFICEREEEIRTFKPEESWTISGLFLHGKKDKIEAELAQISTKKADLKTKEEADAVVKQLQGVSFHIDSIVDKTRTKNPLPPFMTSTLQQAAFNRLGYPVKKTMQIAQKLYEGMPLDDGQPVALITYMRTDSQRIADSALQQARGFISKYYEKEYLPASPNIYEAGKGKAQDAHEAIRPIDVGVTPSVAAKYLPKDAAKLYELIWQRFVACQMKSALYAQRQVALKGNEFIFKVTGSTLIFDGFLKVYGVDEDEKEDKVVLPASIKEKDAVDLNKITPKQHFTTPPPRFTEASLVKGLEKEGIGRPSTYASILSTIQTRSYVTLDAKKRFTPTELGMAVTNMLVENMPKIMDKKFTAHMEEDLDKIANGDLERDKLLREFYESFEEDLKKFIGEKGTKRKAEPTNVDCPECKKSKLGIRFGKTGEFLGCLNFPECTFTCNFRRKEDGDYECVEAEQPKMLDEKCPQCGKPLRQVIGKFGPFIACSGYPTCTYIHRIKAHFPCPECKGELYKRTWRGGVMWGCSSYPKCKFAIFGDIDETPCKVCKSPYMLKKVNSKGDVSLVCGNKSCPSLVKK